MVVIFMEKLNGYKMSGKHFPFKQLKIKELKNQRQIEIKCN